MNALLMIFYFCFLVSWLDTERYWKLLIIPLNDEVTQTISDDLMSLRAEINIEVLYLL